MKIEKGVAKIHFLILPFPVQGHINPMLQFSKRLACKGLKVTLVTFSDKEFIKGEDGLVSFESVSDGSKENNEKKGVDDYLNELKANMMLKLPEIVAKHGQSGYPISCLVYDSMMPWVLDLAREIGIPRASFFTQSCAVCSIYYAVHEGKLSVPIEMTSALLEGLPTLESCDLPSFVSNMQMYPGALSLLASQFLNIEEVDWIFFNAFDSLEEKVVSWMKSQWSIKLVGPTIPSMYLDKRFENDKDYGLSLFQHSTKSCMEWLDSKENSSVVYVAFGSIAALGEKQMQELANGLKMSNYHFLWVVRESEEKKIPFNFAQETSEKGLIVSWCYQLSVLSHRSIGCFVTHCGWNSTLEALSLGVPMVAMPQWTDQPTNAKFIADIWRVGVRAKANEEGIVPKEEIKHCIMEVMDGEAANEIRKNSKKWKKLAKEAIDEGGTSDKNIEDFVAELGSCTSKITN